MFKFISFLVTVISFLPCAILAEEAGELSAPSGIDEIFLGSPGVFDPPPPNAPIIRRTPEKVVDRLSARANDWQEPSRRSEVGYIIAIRQWLESLEPDKREKAREILREAHPGMHALRVAIREKKLQLATLNFDKDTNPETLPRLGQELQELRQTLRANLRIIGDRLAEEAGINMGPVGGDGFWLVPKATTNQTEKRDAHTAAPHSHFDDSGAMADISS